MFKLARSFWWMALSLCSLSTGATAQNIVFGTLNASLDDGSLAGTTSQILFSYDADQVTDTGDSYVPLNSFDFTLLGVPFTRNDIFQGGQVIFHNGVFQNVTASFQVILPPNSPVQNITFGFGGDGVIGYIDLNGQFGSGSFLIENMRVHAGTIMSIRRVGSSDALGGRPGIEIQLFSDDEFPVRNEIMVLQIGARQFFLSGYPNGDLNTVVFTLTEEEFAVVSSGDPVIVQYGLEPSDEVWQFGDLDKTIMEQQRAITSGSGRVCKKQVLICRLKSQHRYTGLYAAFLAAAVFGALFLAATDFGFSPAARFSAQRFFNAATIAVLPAALSLRLRFGG